MTDPSAHSYAETWAGRGVPMDELAAFVARAVDAGAPLTARIHLENADRNILFGLITPGTRMSVTWPYTHAGSNVAYSGPGAHPGSYDETELVLAREDARYRQERAKGGVVDPKRLALVGEPTTSPEPWPFKPGDVVYAVTDDDVAKLLGAAPVGTVVAAVAGDEWKHEGLSSWVGTYRTDSAGLAARGPLTVVTVGPSQ